MAIPYRIQTMINQLGGTGLNGAFTYTGASGITYKEREDGTEPDPSEFLESSGSLFFDVGLIWKVNVKRNQTWKLVVAYEPNDTYTVYLVKVYGMMTAAKKGKLSELKTTWDDVYCDNLQAVAEGAYDDIIENECGGFIPLY